MNPAIVIIGLVVLWIAITGQFTAPNLVLGGAIAALALLLLRGTAKSSRIIAKVGQGLSLALVFLRELAVSAFRVAVIVLTPDLEKALRPGVVAFPLSVKSDAEITLLANMITLTPGTLSIDVSADRAVLHVHVLNMVSQEAVIAEIAGGFERRIRELFA